MKKKRIYFSAFGLTFAVLLILFITCGYAPFGNKSLAVDDASIQYLDFYAYFKDVLAQKNSIFYTFGKTLGGTNIAVFSYYLSSPFMLLSVFFPKENLHSFSDRKHGICKNFFCCPFILLLRSLPVYHCPEQ